MIRPSLAVLAVSVVFSWMVVGCSSAPLVGTEPTVLWDRAREPDGVLHVPLSDVEARRIADSYDSPVSCEQSARAAYNKDPQRGWALMRQCISRHDFSDLEILIEGSWADEMRADHEGTLLFAHVIAARGGDVSADLPLLRRRKIPVYSLQAALAEPEHYRGRLLMLRGNVAPGPRGKGARSFRIVETTVMAESEWVTRAGTGRLITRSNNALADQSDVAVRGRGIIEHNERESADKVEISHNVNVSTGLELVGRVESDEPSLEPGTDYVMVVRFDGTLTAGGANNSDDADASDDDDDDDDDDGSGVVVAYFEPASGMFARLGRSPASR